MATGVEGGVDAPTATLGKDSGSGAKSPKFSQPQWGYQLRTRYLPSQPLSLLSICRPSIQLPLNVAVVVVPAIHRHDDIERGAVLRPLALLLVDDARSRTRK